MESGFSKHGFIDRRQKLSLLKIQRSVEAAMFGKKRHLKNSGVFGFDS